MLLLAREARFDGCVRVADDDEANRNRCRCSPPTPWHTLGFTRTWRVCYHGRGRLGPGICRPFARAAIADGANRGQRQCVPPWADELRAASRGREGVGVSSDGGSSDLHPGRAAPDRGQGRRRRPARGRGARGGNCSQRQLESAGRARGSRQSGSTGAGCFVPTASSSVPARRARATSSPAFAPRNGHDPSGVEAQA